MFKVGDRAVCIVGPDGWFKATNYSKAQRIWFVLTGRRPRTEHPPSRGYVGIVTYVSFSEVAGECISFDPIFDGCHIQSYSASCFRRIDALEEQLERIENEPAELEIA